MEDKIFKESLRSPDKKATQKTTNVSKKVKSINQRYSIQSPNELKQVKINTHQSQQQQQQCSQQNINNIFQSQKYNQISPLSQQFNNDEYQMNSIFKKKKNKNSNQRLSDLNRTRSQRKKENSQQIENLNNKLRQSINQIELEKNLLFSFQDEKNSIQKLQDCLIENQDVESIVNNLNDTKYQNKVQNDIYTISSTADSILNKAFIIDAKDGNMSVSKIADAQINSRKKKNNVELMNIISIHEENPNDTQSIDFSPEQKKIFAKTQMITLSQMEKEQDKNSKEQNNNIDGYKFTFNPSQGKIIEESEPQQNKNQESKRVQSSQLRNNLNIFLQDSQYFENSLVRNIINEEFKNLSQNNEEFFKKYQQKQNNDLSKYEQNLSQKRNLEQFKQDQKKSSKDSIDKYRVKLRSSKKKNIIDISSVKK